jgi:hypothetical protein
VAGDYDWGLAPEAVEGLRRGMVVSVAVEVTPALAERILEA